MGGKRKIDYSLKLEESLPLDYDSVEEFLTDSSNSHVIAATRENTYSRHILLLIIRCLIDYADALFHVTMSRAMRARVNCTLRP